MAIDDETRARAMAAVKRRMAGEASDEDMESALSSMNTPSARRAAAPAATKIEDTKVEPTRSQKTAPDTYGVPSLTPNAGAKSEKDLSVNERFERSARNFARGFPGSSPLASLDAIAGPTAGGLARSTGKFLGSLGSSGRAEAVKSAAGSAAQRAPSVMESPAAAQLAATRATKQREGLAAAQARSTPQRPEISAMEGEGARSITPKMPRKTKKQPARDMDESRFANFRKGGKVSSASSRGDGIASRGKTRGRIC